MTPLTVVIGAAAAIAIVVGPLLGLALAANRYGVDSRPSVDDRNQRPWLWRGSFD